MLANAMSVGGAIGKPAQLGLMRVENSSSKPPGNQSTGVGSSNTGRQGVGGGGGGGYNGAGGAGSGYGGEGGGRGGFSGGMSVQQNNFNRPGML